MYTNYRIHEKNKKKREIIVRVHLDVTVQWFAYWNTYWTTLTDNYTIVRHTPSTGQTRYRHASISSPVPPIRSEPRASRSCSRQTCPPVFCRASYVRHRRCFSCSSTLEHDGKWSPRMRDYREATNGRVAKGKSSVDRGN